MSRVKFYIALGVAALHIGVVLFAALHHKNHFSDFNSASKITVTTTPFFPRSSNKKKSSTSVKKTPVIASNVDEHLLSQLEESLKSFAIPITCPTPTTVKLQEIPAMQLNIDSSIFTSNDTDLQNRLLGELQNNLKMPEFGEVKAELSISAGGTINTVKILESKSAKNKKYLKKTLPALIFPWFNQYKSDKKEYVYVITFKNQ